MDSQVSFSHTQKGGRRTVLRGNSECFERIWYIYISTMIKTSLWLCHFNWHLIVSVV